MFILDEDIDNEEVYKMATVMAECGGLTVMLQRWVFILYGLMLL